MDAYRRALSAYLEPADRTQSGLADKVGTSQASIARYVSGERWPDADTARKIEEATEGEVSFATYQQVTMERLGLGAPGVEAA